VSTEDTLEMIQQDKNGDLAEEHEQNGDADLSDEDSNGNHSDDASEEGVKELRQQVEKLRQELLNEQVARKKVEKQVEELRDEFEDLREQRDDGSGDEVDIVEIEWKARNQPYTEMTSNVERAVKVWESLPNYGSAARDNLSLTYDQLRRAISEVDSRPKNEVNSNTVRRVRTKLRDLSDGLIEIKRKEGVDRRKNDLAVVKVQAWAEQRKDIVVRKLLPEKVADTVLRGEDG